MPAIFVLVLFTAFAATTPEFLQQATDYAGNRLADAVGSINLPTCELGGTGAFCSPGGKQSTRPSCEAWVDGQNHCFLADHPHYPVAYNEYMKEHPEFH
jgi:hypothetical protein